MADGRSVSRRDEGRASMNIQNTSCLDTYEAKKSSAEYMGS